MLALLKVVAFNSSHRSCPSLSYCILFRELPVQEKNTVMLICVIKITIILCQIDIHSWQFVLANNSRWYGDNFNCTIVLLSCLRVRQALHVARPLISSISLHLSQLEHFLNVSLPSTPRTSRLATRQLGSRTAGSEIWTNGWDIF